MITNLLSFGGKILTVGGNALSISSVDPYNPLNLPPYTIRVKLQNGATFSQQLSGTTYTRVSTNPNVWDVTRDSWSSFFWATADASKILEVLGANSLGASGYGNVGLFNACSNLTSVALFDTSLSNSMEMMFLNCTSLTSIPLFDTSNVTSMYLMLNDCTSLTSVPTFNTSKVTSMEGMLAYCSNLTTVPLFDTSNVTTMAGMLDHCSKLESIPLFDTSKVTNMDRMCADCTEVRSGALALYQQASSQATPPTIHTQTFSSCGSDTSEGKTELYQIPSSWGGWGS
jgi:surface protein